MSDDEVLTPEEVDALLDGVSSGAVDTGSRRPPPGDVREHDLVAAQITRDRVPPLDRVNRLFARYLQQAVRALLNDQVEIELAETRVDKYADYLAGMEHPTNVNLVAVPALDGQGLLAIGAPLIKKYVDVYFGGGSVQLTSDVTRDFTATELGVIRRILHEALDCYARAWAEVRPLQLELVRQESNPEFCTFFDPVEHVVATRLDVRLDPDSGGWLDVVFPATVLEPLRELLDATDRGNQDEQRERWSAQLTARVKEARLELSSVLTTTRMSLGRLVRLKAGDIVPIDVPKHVDLCAGDAPVFRGTFGVSNGRNAVRITDRPVDQ